MSGLSFCAVRAGWMSLVPKSSRASTYSFADNRERLCDSEEAACGGFNYGALRMQLRIDRNAARTDPIVNPDLPADDPSEGIK